MATFLIVQAVCALAGVALALAFRRWRARRSLARIMAGRTFEDRALREGLYRQQAFAHFAAEDHGPHLVRAPGFRVVEE